MDLCPIGKQFDGLFHGGGFGYVAFTFRLSLRLVGYSLEEDGTVTDLGEHVDQSQRLGGRALNDVVQFVRVENLGEYGKL